MKLKVLLIILTLKFLITNSFSNEKVYIELKIDEEIITNIDIKFEENYLIALNNNLNKLPKSDLKNLAKDTIIREKIKKKELMKYYDLEQESSVVEDIIKDLFTRLEFKNRQEFIKYLSKFGLNIDDLKEKLKIEAMWNHLIFTKYKNKIEIDENKLRKKLKKNISEDNYAAYEFFLNEILFELKKGETLDKKYKKILNLVETQGFKNSANIFGISETSKFGGEIGWIRKTQLSNQISKELEKIELGKVTNPIKTPNGYLILKVSDKRKIEKEINIENELKKLIQIEKNKQFGEFSVLYFNKIKQNIYIRNNV